MDMQKENHSVACPVCRRPVRADTQVSCDRCGTDLSDYHAIIEKSRCLLAQAARFLPADASTALRLAAYSLHLHATDEARRMIIVAKLCCRQYEEALEGWQQYRRERCRTMKVD